MRMNGYSGSHVGRPVLVPLRYYGGHLEENWWQWGGRGTFICRCLSPRVDTPFVQCFEDVEYEKALGQLAPGRRELVMSKMWAVTELVQFRRPFDSFYLLSKWTY